MSRDKELTWGEYKKLIEDQGVTDDMEIGYIDAGGGRFPKVETYQGGFGFNVTDGDSIYVDCPSCSRTFNPLRGAKACKACSEGRHWLKPSASGT